MLSLEPTPHRTPLRLLYLGTALLILVLLATNAAVILHLRKSERRNEEAQLANLSLTLAEQADRAFQAADLTVSSVVAEAPDDATDGAAFATRMSGRNVHLLLREKISGVPQLSAVTVIGRDGKLVNWSRRWPIPDIDVSDRDYFRALRDDPDLKSYVSAPARNRATGAWTVFLAHRVNGSDGAFLGIVLGAIELRYFEEFYRAISLDESATIALQRPDGVLLVRFPLAEVLGKTFSSAERLLHGRGSATLRESSPIDGSMRLKAAHRLSGFPVVALATKTEDAALANWRGIARLLSLGALGCAVSIALAGFALGRQWRQQAAIARAQARDEERTRAFEAMRAAKEEAEIANRAKSEFLATMSHELRTPLNAVLGFSALMVGEAFGPLGGDRYRDYARDIHSSGSHLLAIVNDVLDLSKAASGKLELAEDLIDAGDVVRIVCRLLSPRVADAGLSLEVDAPPVGPIVNADERLLKQMLLNLLSNACKFTPKGGRIVCSACVDDAGVKFVVADSGIGIPGDDLERVLEPFIQVDGSMSRRHDGAGLGLALVKAMAERHGGSLRLESAPGQGTVATVILPLSRLDSEQADAAQAALKALIGV
jgi:signal transduction histidine kinase